MNDIFERARMSGIKRQKEHIEFCNKIDAYIESNDFGQNECDDILYSIKAADKIGKWGIEIQDTLLHSDTHSVFIDLGFKIKIDGQNTTISWK